MAFTKKYLIGLAILLLIVLIGFTLLSSRHYLIFSLLIMIASFTPFMARFAKQKLTSRELVMLAILGAIAAVSRVPFASLPSVQPTTFVIIVTAIVLGPQSGFVVGVLAAIVSNLFLGQGPWTPWQMYAWGMIGLIAGLMRNRWLMKHIVGRCIYGFVMGFIFGWFMNLWVVLGLMQEFNWAELLAYYSASFWFDLAHGLSNVFFLALFSTSWIRIIERFQRKYGLFVKENP
ncbi:ECF transporter S component [Lentibacillus sp. N15]|uniref:ECF transporter S component n=1 Tax=Lentibacillus songyuanensis TaxID=3136161 RepID=UPI0031BB9D8E